MDNIQAKLNEFHQRPDVVVVWSCPEFDRLWFFEEYMKRGQINFLLFREPTSKDNSFATTVPESINLRLGLNFIKRNYENVYIIGQSADVIPRDGTYKLVDQEMKCTEREAYLFFWQNQIAHANVWHTNFFAVTTNEKYWPPVSEYGDADTLEVQYGKQLLNFSCNNFVVSHNSRNMKFDHHHYDYSESNIPHRMSSGVNLNVTGYKSLYRRFSDFIKRLLWQK